MFPPAAKTFIHLLSIYSPMPHLLRATTSVAAILSSVHWSVYLFSTPVLNNVVAIMLYMNRLVFPEDFHVTHKMLIEDDLFLSNI